MPLDLLVLSAAFLAGLIGSAHCGAMCGGIAVTLGQAPGAQGAIPRRMDPRAAAQRALASNLGRIAGYTLAGTLAGGLGAGVLGALDLTAAAPWIRGLIGLVLLLVALRMAAPAWAAKLPRGPAVPLWQALAPLRAAVPKDGPWRPWVLGLLWGWLPCGLSYAMLAAAWLEASALHGGLLMLAFGLGTLPAMGALAFAGARFGSPGKNGRYAGAALVGSAGVLTLSAPWLAQVPVLHGALAALGCRSVAG